MRPPASLDSESGQPPEASTSSAFGNNGADARCACCGQPRHRPHPFQPALVVRRVPSLEAECGEVMKAFFARRRKESREERQKAGGGSAATGDGGEGDSTAGGLGADNRQGARVLGS